MEILKNMIVLSIVFWTAIICYAIFVLFTWKLWNNIPETPFNTTSNYRTPITVIVPVRNEEAGILNLLTDLASQNYPKHLLEIIIVDDCSDDMTPMLVERFSMNSPIQIHLLRLEEKISTSPKKRAITTAIQQAKGELILTTDGDCRVQSKWVASYAAHYEETNAQFISGPVTFTKETQFTDILQTVEFSSLIGTGAACIQAGSPTMCNGANLAYTKKAFQQVDGFKGFTQIASGDDEFLLHKIKKYYPEGISFLKNIQAIVQTDAHKSWIGFYNQRKRWASKWQFYQTITPKAMAAFVFISNAVLPLTLLLSLLDYFSWGVTLALWLVKCLPEWLLISTILRFLQKSHCILFIPIVQVIYPWYVLLFGLSNNSTKTYLWKGRELQ